MYTSLPIISGAGMFRSEEHFSNITSYTKGTVSRIRTVVDYELELFVEDGGITHLNGQSYPIRKGSLLLAQPGDKRQSTLHFSALFIHFNTGDTMIRELLQTVHGFHKNQEYEKYETLILDICNLVLAFEPDSDLLVTSKLLSLLYHLKKDCLLHPTVRPGVDQRSAVSDAIEYMKQSFKEPLSVRNIAEHCGLSTSYFYRIFFKTTHTTPNDYLLSVRLAVARNLLITTTDSISEIAEKSGFNSPAYFSECFRRHFQISPRQFRETFCHSEERI